MGSTTDQDRFESLFGSLDLEGADPHAGARDVDDISDAFANVFAPPPPPPPKEITVDLELDETKTQAQAARAKRPAELPLPQPEPARDRRESRAGARSVFWALLIAATLWFAVSHRADLISRFRILFM
jgi:hypothetical protein